MTHDDRRSVAEYVASMCAELAAMAEDKEFDTGVYLLQMARAEFQSRWLQLGQAVETRESVG